MSKSSVPNIGRKFLEYVDKFLAGNYQILTCADIHDIYSQFFWDLKEFKGNSTGFTGLSEYLIFRFLYYLLGGSFDRQRVTPDLWQFVSKSHNDLRIGQSIPIPLNRKRCYPDIVIYHSGKLVVVIQIKLYITNSLKEVKKEMKTLEEIRKDHRDLLALMIIFSGLSEKGKVLPELRKERDNKAWFNFLVLKENNELLKQKLQDYLGLERIMVASPNTV